MEPVAHMYPSDLAKFQSAETFAYAYSVAVGNPDERSVPLYDQAAIDAAVAAERERWRSAVLEMRGRLLWLDQRADTRDIDALLEGHNL